MIFLEKIKDFFKTHNRVSNTYFVIILILIASIPFSKFGISVSEFLLPAVWIITLNFKEKFKTLFSNKVALIFISIFILYCIGLIYSTDLTQGLKKVKIKLPLLLFPFIFASIPSFSKQQIKVILLFLVFIIFAKTIQTTSIIFFSDNPYDDIRKISTKLSHIRFSIFIVFSIFVVIYYAFIKEKLTKYKIIASVLIAWFILSLFIIQSITGIIIFFTVSYVFIFYLSIKNKKNIFISLSILLPVSIIIYLFFSITNFYDTETYNFASLEKQTINGNEYLHDTINQTIENGHFVGLYFCRKELKNNWNSVSKIKYDSFDNIGHEIKYTLIRYLTSKGYRKDSIGVYQLNSQDISNIENGIANCRFYNKYNFNNRIYKIIWQFDIYQKGGNPSGHSVTQRFEFLKTAFNLIKDNAIFGVGTGDINKKLIAQYEKDKSVLLPKFRIGTHNQYVTIAISLGIIGLLWIVFAITYPFFKNKKYKQMLPSALFLISLISMLNEDTWETQISVTFFALFYALLIIGKNNGNNNEKNNF